MFKITPSLYSAYHYYVNSDVDDISQMLAVLNREPLPQTEAMKQGINFENEVYYVISTGIRSDNPKINELANLILGEKGFKYCATQHRVSKMLTENVEVHGVIDIITPIKIYDLKRVQNYNLGKYENSIQHLIYMFCTDIPQFEYLIYDGSSIFSEYYHFNDDKLNDLKTRVNTMIEFFMSYEDFKKPFIKNWSND